MSGGKDSTYLLKTLIERYDLNILSFTVDNGLHPNKVTKNIQKIVKFFNVNHVNYFPENDFYKRIYRNIIEKPHDKTYCLSVCGVCQNTIRSFGMKFAIEKDIPLIVGGYSPDQCAEPEISLEDLNKNWFPEGLNQIGFTKRDLDIFWKNEKYDPPFRFFHPLYFLDYPGIEEIVTLLNDLDWNEKINFNFYKTNCHLVWLLIYLDLKKFNYNLYLEYLHNLIRLGKTSRLKWKFLLPLVIFFYKSGFLKRKEIKLAKNYLKLNNDIFN